MTTGKGKINLIGIGPGDPGYLTPAASHALSESDVIVGFRAYIQQIECLIAGKEVVSMELGQELERAAAAVELAAWCAASGRCSASQPRHWAVAWGNDTTRSMEPSPVPGGASRFNWTGITTSRCISRSASNANVSWVTLTLPSMEFSMAAKPRSASAAPTRRSTSGIDPANRRSRHARSDCVRRACSVKVPLGPR